MSKKLNPLDATWFFLQNGLKPLELFPGTQVHWKCECLNCGSIVEPRYYSIKQGQSGCKYCAINQRSILFKQPEEKAIKFMLDHKLRPLEPYVNALTPWKCECLVCGWIHKTQYATVQHNGKSCRKCYNNSHRHTQEYVEKVLLKHGFKLLEKYFRTDKYILCRHIKCDLEVPVLFSNITYRGGGCPHCAKTGYDRTSPGWLYVIYHPQHEAYKIGISNSPEKRLKTHKKNGWVTDDLSLKRFEDGNIPLSIEKSVIKEWRDQGYPIAVSPEIDGAYETVSSEFINLEQIEEQIERIKCSSL